MKRVLRVLSIAAVAASLAVPAFADSLESIKSSGVLKVGFREDARPFAFVGQDGKPAGYSVELCDRIAANLAGELGLAGVNVEYVPIEAAERIEALESGKIDIECGSSTETLERREKVDFSLLTFITGAEMLTKKTSGIDNLETVAGHKVGVLGGTTTETGLLAGLERRSIDAEVIAVANHEEGLALLESGEVDAYFGDRVLLILLALNAKDPSSLKLSGHFYSYEPYALMMRKGDDGLRLVADRTLAELYRSGKIGEVYQRWFGQSQPSDLLKALYVTQGLPEK
jgi:ABC-type amino acid transport substrate-binding protein